MEGADSVQNGPHDEPKWRMMYKVSETLEIIDRFVNMFQATHDTDYIDNAISLADGLPKVIPQVQEMVNLLITMKPDQDGHTAQDSTADLVNGVPITSYYSMNQLSSLYIRRYNQCGGDEDLEKAIQQVEDTLAVIHEGHPDRGVTLCQLALLLGSRFNRFGNLEDIQNTIKYSREAIAVTPINHPDRAGRLNNLSNYLNGRFDRLGDMEDLENAIKYSREAIAVTPIDHPDRAGWLNNLSGYLNNRYQRLGDMEDLENAIKYSREAIAVTPIDHPDRAGRLNNLSSYLDDRYQRLGDMEDLENAIKYSREAIAVTSIDHLNRAAMLSNLSSYLNGRYKRLGDMEDLENAIKYSREVIAVTPIDHPDRAGWLNNLSGYLNNRYQRLGDMEDLENAIKYSREAIAVTPIDHPDRAGRLNNLSSYLDDRYQRLGDMEDLENAIKYSRETIAVTPIDCPDRAGRLDNLGSYLNGRFDRLGDMEDLENAIKYSREVIAVTPIDHPERAGRLNNLGSYLNGRFKRLGDMEDLDSAIKALEHAIVSTPANHPYHAMHLYRLQGVLWNKFQRTFNIQDIQYAIKFGQEAWSCVLSTPARRIKVAQHTASQLTTLKRWNEASSLLDKAVILLPEVSPRHLQRNSQELLLSDVSKLAIMASSIGLSAGKTPIHCLVQLELGRGIIMGTAIDYRSDVSELQAKHPDISTKFDLLRTEIDSPLSYDESTFEMVRGRRVDAVRELAELLAHIRQLPDFARFQLSPTADELMRIAAHGPIIVINSTPWRSDAIIVTNSGVKALPLARLNFEEAEEQMRVLRENIIRGKPSTYRSRNEQLHKFLFWLWGSVVEPVFEELKLYPTDDDSTLPRVWWMGTGLFATAPFHAAGDYSDTSNGKNTMRRAISSYIPTIKALSYARERPLELLRNTDTKLLIVTMAETPGKKSLESASEEAHKIASVTFEATEYSFLESPSATKVLAELESSQAVHFACHGVPDNKSPSNSHLLLFKDSGSEQGTIDRLTVGTIASKRLKNAQIAYLSACSTADNRVEDLADESIHIASGFQLAGFSHVLATLWKSNDTACEEVAVEFYRLLFDGKGDQGHAKVSYAFHCAVKGLWKKYSRQPIIWASFIHTGA